MTVRFNKIVSQVLNESNMASGVMSVLGAGAAAGYNTQAQIPNSDTYATGDARVAKVIGKKIIKRNMPKDSIFTGNTKTRKKHKKRKK